MRSKGEGVAAKARQTQGVVPSLRFPGFEGSWSSVPLSKLASRSTLKNSDAQVKRVLTNSAEFGILDQRDYFDKDIADKGNLQNYYVVEKGDYVYNPRVSTAAPVGPISRNEIGRGAMSPLYTVFRFHALGNGFFAQFFDSGRWHGFLRANSSTGARHDRMSIGADVFMQMPVPHIAMKEQQKIADCLFSLDDCIGEETRKIDTLKAHKKGLMQQLFPAEGQNLPYVRFSGFKEKWKKKMLSEVASIKSGTTPLRAESRFYDGGTISWVKTGDLTNSFINGTEECITSEAKARINQVGSVLVAMYGGFNQIGRTGYLNIPAATNQAISVLNANRDEIVPIYLLVWLNAKVDFWKRIASSSRKDPNITSADVAKFPINYPCKEEQQKIADCSSSLDDLIDTQYLKITALQHQKKALMQNLFPSLDAHAK